MKQDAGFVYHWGPLPTEHGAHASIKAPDGAIPTGSRAWQRVLCDIAYGDYDHEVTTRVLTGWEKVTQVEWIKENAEHEAAVAVQAAQAEQEYS
jgi:hypothetical protein